MMIHGINNALIDIPNTSKEDLTGSPFCPNAYIPEELLLGYNKILELLPSEHVNCPSINTFKQEVQKPSSVKNDRCFYSHVADYTFYQILYCTSTVQKYTLAVASTAIEEENTLLLFSQMW